MSRYVPSPETTSRETNWLPFNIDVGTKKCYFANSSENDNNNNIWAFLEPTLINSITICSVILHKNVWHFYFLKHEYWFVSSIHLQYIQQTQFLLLQSKPYWMQPVVYNVNVVFSFTSSELWNIILVKGEKLLPLSGYNLLS